jgi:site-specific recombinase XerC
LSVPAPLYNYLASFLEASLLLSNLRAVQLLLGHTKMDSTVRYLGVELEDALAIAEAIEI